MNTELATPAEDNKRFLYDVIEGLSQKNKAIPSKYLYDTQGARLFEKICDLDDYYLTRTELALLTQHTAEVAQEVGQNPCVIEFGCGSDKKIRILLKALKGSVTYVPIDICQHYLNEMARSFKKDFKHITLKPLCADFTQALTLPSLPSSVFLGFFPGSTIGNLDETARLSFLRNAHAILTKGSFLLLGVDLRKDKKILHRAYNDSEGITAAFNLNLLVRANRDLNANFDLQLFRHEGRWNDEKGRMEMHLVSSEKQKVQIKGKNFMFERGETIHTENSHKFTQDQLHDMISSSGWQLRKSWQDEQYPFCLVLLQAI